MEKKEVPKVSFIIPTLNADRTLEMCLKAIHTQIYPLNKIEIILVDGGSSDKTLSIAKKYNVKIINNSHVFQEPGKTLGSKNAKGDIIFYIDSDNILGSRNWLKNITQPYIKEKKVDGFLPQTFPPKDSHSLNRYLGYLFTDPLTYFVYQRMANPLDYSSVYIPFKQEKQYILFQFLDDSYPLFGYAQGVGVIKKFIHGKFKGKDDMLSGIELMKRGGIIAYVPSATVYHYHVDGFNKFIKKYTWRTRNNLYQKYNNVGLRNRTSYLNTAQKIRTIIFIPYAFSIIFPLITTIHLWLKFKDRVMLWHFPATIIMGFIITKELLQYIFRKKMKLGNYE